MPIEHLPPRLQAPATRLRAFLMTDATVLIILGVGIIGRGISYIPSEWTGRIDSHPAEGALPLAVWSLIWIAVGILCLVAAFWPEGWPAAAGIGAGIGLNTLWAGSFLTATINGTMPRGWVSAIGYLTIALLALWAVWRGKRVADITPISREAVVRELHRGDE